MHPENIKINNYQYFVLLFEQAIISEHFPALLEVFFHIDKSTILHPKTEKISKILGIHPTNNGFLDTVN